MTTLYLTGIALLFGAGGCIYAAALLVKQGAAERELTKKVGTDPKFAEFSREIFLAEDRAGETEPASDAEIRRKASADMLDLFETAAKTLAPEKRNLVNAGLCQPSDVGRRNYVNKLAKRAAEESEKLVSATV